MSDTRNRIHNAQAAQGWTDETLLALLLDAIDELSAASQDDILIYIQDAVDTENKDCEVQ
jgi:hypothetical protein